MGREDPPPPRRRYKVTIELGADNHKHAAQLLDRISDDMLTEERIPLELISGGGYVVRSDHDPDALAGEEFTDALIEWSKARRVARG